MIEKESKLKIVFVRHMTTGWNLEKRVQGLTDTDLHEQGRREAEEIAPLLLPLGITRILCSDLKRAKQTGGIINAFLKVPISFDERLRECSFGEIEGKTHDEIVAQYGEEAKAVFTFRENYDFHKHGGENFDDVRKRHQEVVNDCRRLHPDEIILLIGHGKGLNTLLFTLREAPTLVRGEYRVVSV